MTNLKAQVARQFFIALQRRGADKLLSILEGYSDTLSDAEMLLLLRNTPVMAVSDAAIPSALAPAASHSSFILGGHGAQSMLVFED